MEAQTAAEVAHCFGQAAELSQQAKQHLQDSLAQPVFVSVARAAAQGVVASTSNLLGNSGQGPSRLCLKLANATAAGAMLHAKPAAGDSAPGYFDACQCQALLDVVEAQQSAQCATVLVLPVPSSATSSAARALHNQHALLASHDAPAPARLKAAEQEAARLPAGSTLPADSATAPAALAAPAGRASGAPADSTPLGVLLLGWRQPGLRLDSRALACARLLATALTEPLAAQSAEVMGIVNNMVLPALQPRRAHPSQRRVYTPLPAGPCALPCGDGSSQAGDATARQQRPACLSDGSNVCRDVLGRSGRDGDTDGDGSAPSVSVSEDSSADSKHGSDDESAPDRAQLEAVGGQQLGAAAERTGDQPSSLAAPHDLRRCEGGQGASGGREAGIALPLVSQGKAGTTAGKDGTAGAAVRPMQHPLWLEYADRRLESLSLLHLRTQQAKMDVFGYCMQALSVISGWMGAGLVHPATWPRLAVVSLACSCLALWGAVYRRTWYARRREWIVMMLALPLMTTGALQVVPARIAGSTSAASLASLLASFRFVLPLSILGSLLAFPMRVRAAVVTQALFAAHGVHLHAQVCSAALEGAWAVRLCQLRGGAAVLVVGYAAALLVAWLLERSSRSSFLLQRDLQLEPSRGAAAPQAGAPCRVEASA